MQNNRKLILFIEWASILAFIPFIILAFYNRPSADDLFLHYDAQKRGLLEAYLHMYASYSSRYTSLFFLFTLTYYRFWLEYYMMVPLLLLVLLYAGTFFCLFTINQSKLANWFNKRQLHFVTRLFLLLFIVVMPEPATGIYWVSASITHMLPIVLLLFSLAFYFSALHSPKRRRLKIAVSAILLFGATGCNEMLALYLASMLIVYVLWLKLHNKSLFKPASLLLMAVLFGNFLLFLGPGQQNRAGDFAFQGSPIYAVSAAVLKYIILLSNIFSNPFFWSCAAGVVLFTKSVPVSFNFNFKAKWWLLYFAVLPFIFYLLVYLVNPSGVPERANNPLTFVLLVSLLIMTIHLASGTAEKIKIRASTGISALIGLGFMGTLFFSKNYLTTIKNQFSAPVYAYIFDKRVQQITAAKQQGRNLVTLATYEQEWENYIDTKVPPMLRKPMTKLVNPYPEIIFFCDDVSNSDWITSYAEYYGIDTIRVNNVKHIRFGINAKAQEENSGFK